MNLIPHVGGSKEEEHHSSEKAWASIPLPTLWLVNLQLMYG